MAATGKAPKQWALSKIETITTYKAWQSNLTYTLSTDAKFTLFLAPAASWRKVSEAVAHRGFADTGDGGPTAADKVAALDMMLGQIANFAPIISRASIVSESKSLAAIWDRLRLHYGFKITGAAFVDYALIKPEAQ